MNEEQINWLKNNLSIKIDVSSSYNYGEVSHYLDIQLLVENQIVSESNLKFPLDY